MGGYTPTGTDATEKYNGSSWAASTTLTAADCAFSAAGTQNAVVVFNGHNDDNGSEIYNGATFSETANRNNSTNFCCCINWKRFRKSNRPKSDKAKILRNNIRS